MLTLGPNIGPLELLGALKVSIFVPSKFEITQFLLSELTKTYTLLSTETVFDYIQTRSVSEWGKLSTPRLN